MNLDVSNLAVIEVFGQEIWITETLVNTWIVMAFLIIFAIIARVIIKKDTKVPSGGQNFIELIIETFDNFVTDTVGENLNSVGPWFFAVAAYLVGAVIISVFGLRAPTADWTTAFALAMCSFIIMIAMGMRSFGPGGYLKSLAEPAWPFLPINLISELAKPISLSFRLFGNMLAGTIIIIMYNGLTPTLASIGIPAILHLIFDIFFGLLQAYIFVIISLSYVSGAAQTNDI